MESRKVSLLSRSFRLGDHKISPPVLAAPMAGYTRLATRILYRRFGASMNVSEMVNAKLVAEGNIRTLGMLESSHLERPLSIQVFGADTESMRIAMPKIIELSGAMSIDLNMGCPVNKISKNGFGVSLMANPDRVYDLIACMVDSSPVPVTVKMRSGPKSGEESYLRIGEVCQQAGASAITLHPRSRQDKFSAGTCNWEHIAKLKKALDIPVLGNGDIRTLQDGIDMLEKTGCDGLMIGRGAVGNPWLFTHLRQFFAGETKFDQPSIKERFRVAFEHFELELKYAPRPDSMFRQVRKSLPEYLSATPYYEKFRHAVLTCSSNLELISLLEKYLNE